MSEQTVQPDMAAFEDTPKDCSYDEAVMAACAPLYAEIEQQAQSIAYWIQSAAEWTDRKMTLDERIEKAEQEATDYRAGLERITGISDGGLMRRVAGEALAKHPKAGA